jgi:hypothetical protein
MRARCRASPSTTWPFWFVMGTVWSPFSHSPRISSCVRGPAGGCFLPHAVHGAALPRRGGRPVLPRPRALGRRRRPGRPVRPVACGLTAKHLPASATAIEGTGKDVPPRLMGSGGQRTLGIRVGVAHRAGDLHQPVAGHHALGPPLGAPVFRALCLLGLRGGLALLRSRLARTSRTARSRSSPGYLRSAAMVMVVLLHQDRNPGIRDSTNLSSSCRHHQGSVSGTRRRLRPTVAVVVLDGRSP